MQFVEIPKKKTNNNKLTEHLKRQTDFTIGDVKYNPLQNKLIGPQQSIFDLTDRIISNVTRVSEWGSNLFIVPRVFRIQMLGFTYSASLAQSINQLLVATIDDPKKAQNLKGAFGKMFCKLIHREYRVDSQECIAKHSQIQADHVTKLQKYLTYVQENTRSIPWLCQWIEAFWIEEKWKPRY